MARRIDELDWSSTPLGNREDWPQSLKLAVALILASGFPMAIRWGPELVLIYNDAYRSILRDKHPEALGHPLREVWWEIYPELGPLNEAILRGERAALFAEDLTWTVQREGTTAEEARFTISYSPIPDADAANGIAGILVTCVETTERVREEEALRVHNQRLETEVVERTRERNRIWEVCEELLGVSNFEGYLTSVNPAWTTLLGWSEDEIKRMHVSELRHPDDAEHSLAGRRRLAEGVPTVRLENRFRHKDGSWRWLAWTLTAENGLIYVIGRDVTAEKLAAEALRESERQFRLFAEAATDHALIRLDAHGVVSGWNAGAQRIKGYTEAEIVGQHFSRFYTAADRAAGAPERALAMTAAAGSYEQDGWRVRKDGSAFLAAVVIDAIRDEEGELIGFAKIVRDVTERHEARVKLQRAQEQLAQSQKMEALGQLTGGIAHDFNNMLMVVSGNAQMLKRRLHEPPDLRSVEAIEVAAARGENLTRQLLAFSRRQTLNPVVVSLRQRLMEFRDLLVSSARGDIKLVIDIARSVWPVAVDIHGFELALINLVVNARDAMPAGGTITITARNLCLEADDAPDGLCGEFVALTVTDTGRGIEADILPKVFEPFFTTKQLDKGTGLGLSQVYGLTRQSGGTVTISSEVGSGTGVTIYLPRSYSRLGGQLIVEGEPPRGDEAILLVEDNPEVREIAGALLEHLGYRVFHAQSVAAALQFLASGEAVDLVFTDIVMPGDLDGLALAQRVKEQCPQTAVLLTSGYAKAANIPASGLPVLRKPYQLASLARAIREALDTQPAALLTRVP
ncbi:MAG: PAS domain S-box protein [Alphaproteobacteria bacterium]|nr:PAS domain S-box protein [Alphaproteobacteria bacterium]